MSDTQLAIRPSNALAIETSRAAQEVQASLVIAKRFPRDEKLALDKIVNACTRPTLAQSALYSFNRGGSDVSGPSIRLAETIARHWGNLEFGWRELSRGIDEKGVGYSDVQAVAWDMETNTRKPIMFTVRHWRDRKNGGGYAITDERDIYELCANLAARRVRACILALIPGDVVDEAVQQCETTLTANADTSPEGIKRLVTAFEKVGVSREQIEARIARRLESIQPAQVVNLRKIYASIQDGMSKATDWFDAPVPVVPEPRQRKPKEVPNLPPSLTELREKIAADKLDAEKVGVWLAKSDMPAFSDMTEDDAAQVLAAYETLREACK